MNQQQQYPKNPNSGYLNPSDYGEGKWTGVVTINGALFRLNINEAKQGKFGKPYRRATLNMLTQEQVDRYNAAKSQNAAQPAAPVAPQMAQAPIPGQPVQQQPVPQQAPVQQQAPVPQAAPTVNPLDDEIPF